MIAILNLIASKITFVIPELWLEIISAARLILRPLMRAITSSMIISKINAGIAIRRDLK
jgi:hypothetical protein